VIFPYLRKNWQKRDPLLDHLGDEPRDKSIKDLHELNEYLGAFLEWLVDISTPERDGVAQFVPGLVNVNFFAFQKQIEERDGENTRTRKVWQLKEPEAFNEKHLANLFCNLENSRKPNARALFHAAAVPVRDLQALGSGRLVRAIYEACKLS